jgi:hypothetical protein
MGGRATTPTIAVADADYANGFDVALRDLRMRAVSRSGKIIGPPFRRP